MGIGELGLRLVGPLGRTRQQRLERLDIARKGRSSGFHDRDGITETRPDEAQNAIAEKKTTALSGALRAPGILRVAPVDPVEQAGQLRGRSEEHTSELQSLMRISYAVFCLKTIETEVHMNRNNRT